MFTSRSLFRKFPWLVLLSVFPVALASARPPGRPSNAVGLEKFAADLDSFRHLLAIPGMSATVVNGDRVVWSQNFGFADVTKEIPVTDSTEFCIASVSKTMAAVILMQLVQSGQIRLDDPLAKYVTDPNVPAGVTLRELMSHTSDGTPGEEFLYNGARYGLLSRVIEKVTGKPYATVLSDRILRPLGMSHTIPGLDAPGYEELQRRLALPYQWDAAAPANVRAGKLPAPGLSAANGVISIVSDLAKYAIALDGNGIATRESKSIMFTPTRSIRGEDLPYGLGWFVQDYQGARIVWHFGQEDSYASLFVRVPARKLTLIVLANSNAISDAFRLLEGNVARSLPALYFFKDVVLGQSAADDARRNRLTADEEIDHALAELYINQTKKALDDARSALLPRAPTESQDMATLYLLMRLHDPSLADATETIGTSILLRHPHLPTALFFFGTYQQLVDQPEKAIPLFKRIAEIQPPLRHWSATAALLELGKWYASRDPALARKYLQQVVSTGYDFDGAVEKAGQMLGTLPRS
jgi:CubicO group peptidase (beta-lactamase class C family)